MAGQFITFEGAEGSGKSTQMDLAYEYLKEQGVDVITFREPGGVQISEKIRDLLLDVKNVEMSHECETLLYMAARSQLVIETLLPTLKKGTNILCDRFLDSTIVYQGYGHGVDIEFIKKLGNFVTHGVRPSLTLLFDAKIGLSRITRSKDRIERRAVAYHNRVRQGYLKLAQSDPKRIKVIESGDKQKKEIFNEVKEYIDAVFGLTV